MISLHGRVAYLLYDRMLYRLVVIASLRNLSKWAHVEITQYIPTNRRRGVISSCRFLDLSDFVRRECEDVKKTQDNVFWGKKVHSVHFQKTFSARVRLYQNGLAICYASEPKSGASVTICCNVFVEFQPCIDCFLFR